MTTLHNLTAHPVTIIGPDGSIDLPACASPPRVGDVVVGTRPTSMQRMTIPVHDVVPGAVSGLPEPRDGVLFIVPRIVAAACPRSDLVIPFDAVRDDAGRVVGCRALARLLVTGG